MYLIKNYFSKTMKNIKYLILFLLPLQIFAQEVDSAEKITHSDHHHHEIGIGISPVYFVKEKVLSSGLHVHYQYNLPDTKFGVGAGFERIFDTHKHNTFSLIFSYRPVDQLSFSISPGLASENNEFDKSHLAMHFETAYEFEIHNFHLGPVFEIAADKEDLHISLGLHLGFGF